jgi:hypothetical protein
MTDHTNTPSHRCRHYPDRTLQKKDLALEMKVCERTIDNLVAAGELPEPAWMNSIQFWMLHDVHDFISAAAGTPRGAEKPKAAGTSAGQNSKKTSGRTSAQKAGKYRA